MLDSAMQTAQSASPGQGKTGNEKAGEVVWCLFIGEGGEIYKNSSVEVILVILTKTAFSVECGELSRT
jgi:hypothetical protein